MTSRFDFNNQEGEFKSAGSEFNGIRHSARINIFRKKFNLAITYRASITSQHPLVQEWRKAAGNTPFLFIQQMGPAPTYLGISCQSNELGCSFAQELVCGGWLWKHLRQQNILFIVTREKIEVRIGLEMRIHQKHGEYLTAIVLPIALKAIGYPGVNGKKHALAKHFEQPCNRSLVSNVKTNHSCHSGTVFVKNGSRLFVEGALLPLEARSLTHDLYKDGVWQPEYDGDATINFSSRGVEVTTELGTNTSSNAILEYAADYARYVVLSDLHLGIKGHDSFGPHKASCLERLLQDTINRKSTLVLNGDILELLHAPYGSIKRSYQEIFNLLPKVRRIIYVAGNHDDDILQENIKQARRRSRAIAEKNALAQIVITEQNDFQLNFIDKPKEKSCITLWQNVLENSRLKPMLKEILKNRDGKIFISRGFSSEGVAFQRLGPRNTPQEHPVWYIDETALEQQDAPALLLKLIEDRRQRLDKVIMHDWNHRVEIQRYFFDSARGLYFEHGHFSDPKCHESHIGRSFSVLAGWAKKCGLRQIEHWWDDRICSFLDNLAPSIRLRQHERFIERTLAVASTLNRFHDSVSSITIICGHTHEPAAVHPNPTQYFVSRIAGANYANTGAWSSRMRLSRNGQNQVEWLEINAANQIIAKGNELIY